MLKIKKLVVAFVLSALLTFGVLSVISWAVTKAGILPGTFSGTLTAAAGGISVLVSALILARWTGERGLVHGVALSLIYCVACVAVGYLLLQNLEPVFFVVRMVIFVLCGAIGGVIGVSMKRRMQF